MPALVLRLPSLAYSAPLRTIGGPTAYSTHTMRRTKPILIYRRIKNLGAVQLLPGHTRLQSTVRYPGIEIVDALEMAEQTDAQEQGRRQLSLYCVEKLQLSTRPSRFSAD